MENANITFNFAKLWRSYVWQKNWFVQWYNRRCQRNDTHIQNAITYVNLVRCFFCWHVHRFYFCAFLFLISFFSRFFCFVLFICGKRTWNANIRQKDNAQRAITIDHLVLSICNSFIKIRCVHPLHAAALHSLQCRHNTLCTHFIRTDTIALFILSYCSSACKQCTQFQPSVCWL